ncbi:MAG: DUF2892 domain-containing protein [Chloroflexi bacterium]|nr:DUF2892 domain-containing protein [Chloroflexota bacterium]
MTPNKVGLVRFIKIIAGVVLFALCFAKGVVSIPGIAAGTVGAVLLISGTIGFSPLFSLIKIKTNTNLNPGSEKSKSNVMGLKITISLVLAVVGYKLGSGILPMLSFTSWERHAVSYQASYLGNLNNAYSQSALYGGILGAIIFIVLGLVIIKLIFK